MAGRLRVLLVEDDPNDARLAARHLERGRDGEIELTHVTRLAEALPRLADEVFDAVLLDLGLPDTSGLQGFARVRETAPDIAVVVLSGHADRATAIAAVRQGAQDYVLKDYASGELLVRSLRYAVERKRLATELEATARDLRDLLDAIPAGLLAVDADNIVIEANRTALEWLDRRQDEVIRRLKLWDVLSTESYAAFQEVAYRFKESGFVHAVTLDLVRRDKTRIPIRASATALSDAYGRFVKARFILERLPEPFERSVPPEAGQEAWDRDEAGALASGRLLRLCPGCLSVEQDEGVWITLQAYLLDGYGVRLAPTRCPKCSWLPHPRT